MKRYVWVSALFVLLTSVLLPCSGQTQYRLKEIQLTPKGVVKGLVVVLYGTYELRIDQSGRLQAVEIVTFGDGNKEYRFADGRTEKLGRGLEACVFDGKRVDRIGDYQFRYRPGNDARIESIGDTLFTYQQSSGGDGRIDKIGTLEFRYSVAEGRIESIGSLKMEYRVGDKYLDSFARLFAKDKEQSYILRVIMSVKE